ncbi:uncharacterized protein F5891DRAFT_1285550 [Suillus fuscotomentosus]|uniref:RRM domain-containing protein n=1 Tax=Suillus fuscotomentosus TaxID=1912939 RepID=A0AAD4HBJ8_9AGAM|nr:uncharacterized protein F5891DRAFT_1285550 [Suillus fuscotomentosus]KAG1882284.1 hypothetical protein F5891DRAFT_1285550 [Suillus fuscotomentosus]
MHHSKHHGTANNKTSSPSAGKNSDARRNLYVLGLPFDLTKPEFSALFSRFSTVMHAVILATVDNASRCRGFVVMSSHEEAKRAMKDTPLMYLEPSYNVLKDDDAGILKPFVTSGNGLLVSNLPILLFAQASDLHRLFYTFGLIKEVKLMDSAMLGNGTTTALVEYVNVFDAQEAKEALQRQFFGTSRLEVQFIQDNIYPVNSTAAAYAQSPMLPKTSDAGLNPCAAPFVFGSRHLPPLASGLSAVAHDSFVNDLNLANRPSLHWLTPAERPSSGSTLVVELSLGLLVQAGFLKITPDPPAAAVQDTSVYVDFCDWPLLRMDVEFNIDPDEFQARKRRRMSTMTTSLPPPPKVAPTSAPGVHKIATFLPGRLEFEHELDNEAEDLVKDLEFGICHARGGDQIMEDENGLDVRARARMQEERKTVAGSRNSSQPPVNGVSGNGHLSMNVSSSKRLNASHHTRDHSHLQPPGRDRQADSQLRSDTCNPLTSLGSHSLGSALFHIDSSCQNCYYPTPASAGLRSTSSFFSPSSFWLDANLQLASQFLSEYYFSLCDAIPPRCIQLRNIILSAFPMSIILPDPHLHKFDSIPEMGPIPPVLSDFASCLKSADLRNNLYQYLLNCGTPSFLTTL